MKSKSLREVVLTDSPALTAVISYWKEYDKDSVILSYLELKRRNYEIKGNIEKKLTDFSTQHQKELSELVSEYKKENDFENYDDYYSNFKSLLDSEKQASKIIEQEKKSKKTIFTPVNILLFIGLCIGCYIPAKYLIQSLDGTPKCSDSEVTTILTQILEENEDKLLNDGNMYNTEHILSQLSEMTGKPKFKFILKATNIRTNFTDKETKSCDCTADIERLNFDDLDIEIKEKYPNENLENILKRTFNNINYTVQKNSDGEINVSVYKN